jgi:hypothetical protein
MPLICRPCRHIFFAGLRLRLLFLTIRCRRLQRRYAAMPLTLFFAADTRYAYYAADARRYFMPPITLFDAAEALPPPLPPPPPRRHRHAAATP